MFKQSESVYYLWLTDLIYLEKNRKWIRTIPMLYRKTFVPILPNDDNREADGLSLRDEFETLYAREDYPGGCTCLEMLIALARRVSFQTLSLTDDDDQNRASMFFWILIKNLKLSPNVSMYTNNSIILDNFILRQYSMDGDGGLFPLRNSLEDQRNVEIWYQMMAWVSENY